MFGSCDDGMHGLNGKRYSVIQWSQVVIMECEAPFTALSPIAKHDVVFIGLCIVIIVTSQSLLHDCCWLHEWTLPSQCLRLHASFMNPQVRFRTSLIHDILGLPCPLLPSMRLVIRLFSMLSCGCLMIWPKYRSLDIICIIDINYQQQGKNCTKIWCSQKGYQKLFSFM